jgi:hypothetical protein
MTLTAAATELLGNAQELSAALADHHLSAVTPDQVAAPLHPLYLAILAKHSLEHPGQPPTAASIAATIPEIEAAAKAYDAPNGCRSMFVGRSMTWAMLGDRCLAMAANYAGSPRTLDLYVQIAAKCHDKSEAARNIINREFPQSDEQIAADPFSKQIRAYMVEHITDYGCWDVRAILQGMGHPHPGDGHAAALVRQYLRVLGFQQSRWIVGRPYLRKNVKPFYHPLIAPAAAPYVDSGDPKIQDAIRSILPEWEPQIAGTPTLCVVT